MSCGQLFCQWLDIWLAVAAIAVFFFGLVDQHLEDEGMTWREFGRVYAGVWRRRFGRK